MGRKSGAQFWTLGRLCGDVKRQLNIQGYRAEDRGQRKEYEDDQNIDGI